MEFWLIALYITRFGNQKSYVLPKKFVYFLFFNGSQNKERLFRSTALTD